LNFRFYSDSLQQVRVLLELYLRYLALTPVWIEEFSLHLSKVTHGCIKLWSTDSLGFTSTPEGNIVH
jgi:hypothetical protein